MSTERAPRTGMSGAVGVVDYTRSRFDSSPVLSSICVPKPHHVEVDYWFCTCGEGANDERYFSGPTAL